MYFMGKKIVILEIDWNIYDQYRAYCESNNISISQEVEGFIEKKVNEQSPKESINLTKDDFKDNYSLYHEGFLREYLFNFGHPISTQEMRREFYLKNRLSEAERKNLLDVMGIMENAALKNKLCYAYAVLAIGSSTYPDEFYQDLEKSLSSNNLTREDFVVESADYYNGDQFSNYKTYEEYLEKSEKENANSPFDEQTRMVSKEIFEKCKDKEQKPYEIRKKIGDIIDNKGEDLDFLICNDNYLSESENIYASGSKYDAEKQLEFKSNLIRMLEEASYKVFQEYSYLGDHSYRDFRAIGGNFERTKEIMDSNKNRRETYRVEAKTGRPFHFYITADEATGKVTRERIDNYSFAQLLRKSNFDDFRNAIMNGEKTGIYENPLILKVLGRSK